jgi:hypothetical protein
MFKQVLSHRNAICVRGSPLVATRFAMQELSEMQIRYLEDGKVGLECDKVGYGQGRFHMPEAGLQQGDA